MSKLKFRHCAITCLLAALAVTGCTREAVLVAVSPEVPARPNILLIVADDLGYSDVGAFGSQVATPNIDGLAAEGMVLTQFHVSPNCGPTRGSMMTGVDPHRAGMAGNHGANAPNQDGQPGYEGHLRKDVVTIAELLRDSGYHTYMTGKWHFGEDGNSPENRGFERSYALLNGAASHWQDQAPIIPGSKTRYVSDGELVEELPEDFYSSKWYTDNLISYIDAAPDDNAPFFAFLSFTAPHNPLHVPREYIDKYSGRFDQGWAYAAATPLRLFKGYVAQGGIQVPAVVKLPGNRVEAGQRSNRLTHVMDLMPTFLAVAGASYPAQHKGEAIVPLQGKSLLPLLQGETSNEDEPREIGWSAYGMDAYRQGHWKALRLPEPYGNGGWQLYDLEADPGELQDLASKFPNRVEKMSKGWQNYAELNGVIEPTTPTFYAKPVVGSKY